MRALKTLLIILLAVVVLAVILGLVGPKHSHLERDVVIAAPPALVWDHVNTLKRQNEWSPFLAMDPGMKVSYDGTDGAVGAKSSWAGEKSGQGEQVIASVDPGKQLAVDLHFIEPFESEAKGNISLTPAGDSTKVSWSFDSENGFVSRIFYVFKDMDTMLGPVFANGLAQLKQLCEADAAKQAEARKGRTFRGFTIDMVERPATTYLGKRQVVKWDMLGAYFGTTFGMASQAAAKADLQLVGPPSGLFFQWDTLAKSADVFAGMPVLAGSDAKVDGLQMVEVPAGKALKIAYLGNYDGTEKAHYAMDDMMKANGLELRDAVIEEYVTDPTTEPDTAKWLTNIYYPIK